MVALLVLNQREAKYLGVSDGAGENVLLILFLDFELTLFLTNGYL